MHTRLRSFLTIALCALIISSVGAVAVYAADGSGINTVNPTSATINSTGNTFTFTFTPAETMDSGEIKLLTPPGWSTMQGVIGTAGYTTASTVAGTIADVVNTLNASANWIATGHMSLSADAADKQEGTASLANAITATAAANEQWYFNYGAATNWGAANSTNGSRVGFWLKSSVNTASGNFSWQDDDSANLASPLDTLAVPALTANTWTYSSVTLGAARAAQLSYGFRYTTDIGAATFKADSISSLFDAADVGTNWNATAGVTQSLLTTAGNFKEGTGAIRCTFAVAATAGDNCRRTAAAGQNFTIGAGTKVSFWVRSSVALNAGDFQWMDDDSATLASPEDTVSLPALAANAWTYVTVTAANSANKIVRSYGINQAVDKGALTFDIDAMGKVISDADSTTGWSAPTATVQTLSADAAVFHEGTASLKNIIAATASAGDTWYQTFGAAQNWSAYTTVGFWIRSTVTTTAGQLKFEYSSASDLTSPIASINIGALTANTWTYQKLTLTGTRTSVSSYGINYATDIGAATVNVDDVLIGPGSPTFAAGAIDVRLLSLASGQTVLFSYGNGGGASGVTAPSVTGVATAVTTNRVSDSGTLTNIAVQPTLAAKATPTLSVTNSPVTYNGSPQSATVSGSVPGVVSSIKYNGSATVPTNAATYAITADFVPTDTNTYNSLTGASAGSFVITKATPTLSVTNSPITYDAAPHSAAVSGSVPGVASSILTSGAASQTNAGTYAVTANFTPTDTTDYNSLTAASAGNFVINTANQTITFGALADKSSGDPDFVVSATASSGLTVSFTSQTASVCTVTVATVHLVGTGTCTLQASQAGNGNYNAAANVDQSFSVNKLTPTLSVTNSPVTYNGSPQSATVSGSVPGVVSSIKYNGSATVPTNAATYAITADFVPTDTNTYNSLTGASAGNFVINTADQTITFNALTDKTLGDPDFLVSATASSGLTVSFASQTASVCTVTVATVHLVGTGTCTLQASQAGNANYNAAPNVDQSFSVTQPVQGATKFVIVPPASGTVGTPVVVTVQAQKPDNSMDTSYQQDVTLNTSGSATGGGLVNITNGVGTKSISDTVAETVNLSLTDSESTGLDVSSTQPLTFSAGAVAQFTLDNPGDVAAGTRIGYTVTRKDQFGTPVTTGSDTVRLYSSSDGANKKFFDAATDGNVITSVTIPNGVSSAQFWAYDEKAGNWFITASDNSSAPDGATGIADASDALTVQPASVAKFLLNDPGNMTVSTRLGYTVTRKDAFNNLVTSGVALAYLYTTSSGATAAFYDAAVDGAVTAFATINDGSSTGSFWYFDEEPGTWTITASDNSSTPDGATGITDASDSVGVHTAPIVATRFVILPVTSVQAGQATSVTVEAQNGSGDIDTTYQTGVSLVTSGSATGGGPVSIANGVGTLLLSDAVAETVNLSLLDTQATGLDVSSTQSAVFTPSPTSPATTPAASSGVAAAPITVSTVFGIQLSGLAPPRASVLALAVTPQGSSLQGQTTAASDGKYSLKVENIEQGVGFYGIVAVDELGRKTQVKTFHANTNGGLLGKTEDLSPTLGLVHPTVRENDTVGFIGSAIPGYVLSVQVDGQDISEGGVAGADGSYKILFPTNGLTLGSHTVRVQETLPSGIRTDYTPQQVFTVTSLFTPQTDFNQDGVINTQDWSIFLARWNAADAATRLQDDLNGDGKIDVSDLSIFVRTLKK